MTKKLELLKKISGKDYTVINDFQFKDANGRLAIILHDNLCNGADQTEYGTFLRLKAYEEIPYLEQGFLMPYLPIKFHNNPLLVAEMQELAKYDHTILSDVIWSGYKFMLDVIRKIGKASLLSGYDNSYIVNYEAGNERYVLVFEDEN